jgi:hypothetical protein
MASRGGASGCRQLDGVSRELCCISADREFSDHLLRLAGGREPDTEKGSEARIEGHGFPSRGPWVRSPSPAPKLSFSARYQIRKRGTRHPLEPVRSPSESPKTDLWLLLPLQLNPSPMRWRSFATSGTTASSFPFEGRRGIFFVSPAGCRVEVTQQLDAASSKERMSAL